MTRTWVCTVIVGVAIALLATGASAQIMGAVGPEGTLTVTVSGTAVAPADWVEVSLPISASGASADAALMGAQDSRERTVAELLKADVKQEQIKTTMTQIAALGPQPMDPNAGGPGLKFSASSTIRVRMAAEAEGLYEAICGVLDAAATASAGTAAAEFNVMAMMRGGQDSVTYGVDDPQALTGKAVADALAQSRSIAEQAATAAGKALGELVALQVLPPGQSGLMGMLDMLGGLTKDPQNNGKAVATTTVSATYRMK